MIAVLIELTALTSPGDFWGLGVRGAGYTFLCDPLNNTSALSPSLAHAGLYVCDLAVPLSERGRRFLSPSWRHLQLGLA